MEEAESKRVPVVGFNDQLNDVEDCYMYFGDNYDSFSEESIKIAEPKYECGLCADLVTAYCHVCEEYLCGSCLLRHRKRPETSAHKLCYFYCSDHWKVNKTVTADRYCRECSIYLCDKCATMHLGFRKWRRHVFTTGLDMPFVETINYTQLTNQLHRSRQQRSSRMITNSGRSRNTCSAKTVPSARKIKRP
ncbi:hypothetical protein ACF0H5_011283 [Mactra antiquata]